MLDSATEVFGSERQVNSSHKVSGGADQRLPHLKVFFPNQYTRRWVANTCGSLVESMVSDPDRDLSLYSIIRHPENHDSFARPLLPWSLRFLQRALTRDRLAEALALKLLLASRSGDIAYIWIHTSSWLNLALKARGAMTVKEMINCTKYTRAELLESAYAALGWSMPSPVPLREMEAERQDLLLYNAVFSPSAMVTKSLVEAGVLSHRILEAGYGFEPSRLGGANVALAPGEGLTVLFVGTGDVRKGLPWLLKGWAEAKVKGRLVIAGQISEEVARHSQRYLDRDDVIILGHVEDIGAVYRSADVFVLPSIEEGSPLVTYEAMASGLIPVVTPMGGGSAAISSEHSVRIEPNSAGSIADALNRLANNSDERRQLASSARAWVQGSTWKAAGTQRATLLAKRYRQWKEEVS